MRGRLIQRLVCVLRRLDPAATAAVVGGGYDPEFGEPRPVPNGTQLGAPSRRELAAVRLGCQIDRVTPEITPERLLLPVGQQDVAALFLALFVPELQAAGLLDGNGTPTIYPGDRIEALEAPSGAVQRAFPVPPGMYVTGCTLGGFGLAAFGTPEINLVLLRCAPAPLGSPA